MTVKQPRPHGGGTTVYKMATAARARELEIPGARYNFRMTCPKCGAENPDGVQFCTTCHATLLFKCPKCEHMQNHGGVCDACGLNLTAFWAAYLETKTEEDQKLEHDKTMAAIHNAAAIATAPIAAASNVSQFFLFQLFGRLFGWLSSRG